MKKIIFAGLFLVLLAGCVNPFAKKTQPKEAVVELKSYVFEFVVERGVAAELADLFIGKIKQRIAAYGYEESQVVLAEGGKVKVELSEKSGVVFLEDDFVAYMLSTPTFEIRAEEDEENLFLTDEEQAEIAAYNQKAKAEAEGLLRAVLDEPETFAQLARENSEDPGSRDNGGAYLGVTKGQFVPEYEEVIFNQLEAGEIYPEVVETTFGYHVIKKDAERGEGDERQIDTSHILISQRSEEQLLLAKQWLETGLNGLYISGVNPVQQAEAAFAFQLVFNEQGREILADLTREYLGQTIGIFFDEQSIGTAVVNEEITDGVLIIGGSFSRDQVSAIAERLNSGTIHARLSAAE